MTRENPSSARTPNALGQTARQRIVAAAEAVLKKDGFHGFSTRKVAEACGISVGNLTYHFPSKRDLVQAVMAEVCARYASLRRAPADAALERPRAWLTRTLSFLIKDASGPETSGLFVELWAIAKHHDFGRETVDRFYEDALGWIREDLALSYPEASPEALSRAASLALTLTEGSTALFSRGLTWPGGIEDMVETTADAMEALLKAR